MLSFKAIINLLIYIPSMFLGCTVGVIGGFVVLMYPFCFFISLFKRREIFWNETTFKDFDLFWYGFWHYLSICAKRSIVMAFAIPVSRRLLFVIGVIWFFIAIYHTLKYDDYEHLISLFEDLDKTPIIYTFK
jgi:hypothetical protein